MPLIDGEEVSIHGVIHADNVHRVCLSCSVVSHSATPWTAAHQAPLSTGFSRQEHCSGSPFPSPDEEYDSAIKKDEINAICSTMDGPGDYHTG